MARRNGTPNPALRQARANGDKFYQPDFLCNNGHMTKRLTGSGACYQCHHASSEANRKKQRASSEEFRAKKRAELARWQARIGGTNYIENIQILCRKCNRSKSCLNPADWEFVKQRIRNLAKPEI